MAYEAILRRNKQYQRNTLRNNEAHLDSLPIFVYSTCLLGNFHSKDMYPRLKRLWVFCIVDRRFKTFFFPVQSDQKYVLSMGFQVRKRVSAPKKG